MTDWKMSVCMDKKGYGVSSYPGFAIEAGSFPPPRCLGFGADGAETLGFFTARPTGANLVAAGVVSGLGSRSGALRLRDFGGAG